MTSVETCLSKPRDFSRNLSEQTQKAHQKSYKLISNPGSRSVKHEKTPYDAAQDQVLSPEDGMNAFDLNASATRPSSSTSVTRSISNQSIKVETQEATTQDTAANNSSKDLKSSSRNGISDEDNNQEETLVCQHCRIKFSNGKTYTTTEEFLLGGQYCNACQKAIADAEPSFYSGPRIKEKEERSSPGSNKRKQETTNKKKTRKKWF